ncbi:MAG: DUF58 domain-containing protein [archaeon]
MHELKVDLRPQLKDFVLSSLRGIESGQMSKGAQAGMRKEMMFKGKGLEFEKFREFNPGDDASSIDWKASLRSGRMLVRVYAEERNKDIVFFVDASSSMAYSSWGKMKNEYAVELVTSLSYSFRNSGDNTALAMFSDRLVDTVPPETGIMQHTRILRSLTRVKNYDGPCNFVRSVNLLMEWLKRPAVIFIVSDFIGFGEGWQHAIEAASVNFEIMGLVIRDPADDIMPLGVGQMVFSDPFTGEEILVDPAKIKRRYDRYNQEFRDEIRRVFRRINTGSVFFHTDDSFVKPISAMFA